MLGLVIIGCCVVVMMLLLSFFTFCCVANAAAAVVGTLQPPLLLSVGGEDDSHSTHANCSPTALVHAVWRVLKARRLLDRPLPASCVGGKDGKGDGGNNDGDASGGG